MSGTEEMLLEERRRLMEQLKGLEEDEKAILREMEKVDDQIEYYRKLVRDMKSTISPPLFTKLMGYLGGR